MTDDRVIKDLLKKDPSYHQKMADRLISKMSDKLKKPGVTSADQSRILNKMKLVSDLKKKIGTTGLSEYHVKP